MRFIVVCVPVQLQQCQHEDKQQLCRTKLHSMITHNLLAIRNEQVNNIMLIILCEEIDGWIWTGSSPVQSLNVIVVFQHLISHSSISNDQRSHVNHVFMIEAK